MIEAVLLLAFGGPTAPSEIRPFLANVARGRRISAERLEEVAHHYEQMPGGRSPLNALTFAQARGLTEALEARGVRLPVFVGMRNWHPYVQETLAEMAERGVKRALAIILSSLRTEASWERYVSDVGEARHRTPRAPDIVFAPPWTAQAGFLDAVVARAREALAEVPEARRSQAPVIFTAHSIPAPMAAASPYVTDLAAAAHAVAERLACPRWSIAYQSRSGSPGDPWLTPDIADVRKGLAGEGVGHVVVVPIGFVCDHVELLYDLDIEAMGVARAHGLTLHRARAVNDHPAFIAMLADLVSAAR